MAVATIKLVNEHHFSDFYFSKDPALLTRELMAQGLYNTVGSMGIPDLEGRAVAEEVFDLTNNPSRQDQREALYGRGRSLSVGDVVNVDSVDYLCCNIGWIKL